MIIYLPSNFDRTHMYEVFDQVIDQDRNPRYEKIVFNFSTLRFIKPVGVTILANLVEWLKKRNVECFFRYPASRNDAVKYLDDSLFFQRYIGRKINEGSSKRDTTIALHYVSYENSYDWLDRIFISWLSQRLNISSVSLSTIKTCLGEVFNNIKDHSNENIGCVFAQHYPNMNYISIAVSDFGVGIPYNVQRKFPEVKDYEAIERSIMQGFTTKSTPRNTGAGLDILIKTIVNNNKGSVYIHSNSGILKNNNVNSKIVQEGSNINSYYPGTLFEIILQTDTLESVLDCEEEFEWL